MTEVEALKQENNDIKELIKITTEIYHLNQKLKELELTGNFDSEEFLDVEIKKESLLDIEDNLYARLLNNGDEILNIFDYFKEFIQDETFTNEINLIVNNEEKELITLRIIKRLGQYITDCKVFAIDPEELKYFLNLAIKLNNFSDLINEDIANTILAILNEYLQNPDYLKIKDSLLTLKYNIEFIYTQISMNLIRNNYVIPKELFWKSIYEGEYLKINDSTIDSYYEDKVKDTLQNSINFIMDQYLLDLEDNSTLGIVTICQILIRSMSLFIKDAKLEVIKEKYQEMTEINKLIFDDKTGAELVLEALNKYQVDLELPQIIRLRRNL